MNMDRASSERWVVISALAVIGIYAYRRITEPVLAPSTGSKIKSAIGLGNPLPVGAFVTAWGFTFMVVSIMASASPPLGGSFAILIAVGDALTNTAGIVGDVTKQESAQQLSTQNVASGQALAAAGQVNPNKVQGGVQIVGGQTQVGAGQIGHRATTFTGKP